MAFEKILQEKNIEKIKQMLRENAGIKSLKEETFNAEKVAETFVNGNISDARRAIAGKIARFVAVRRALKDMGQETESFDRLMSESLNEA